jgi:hypothetical protein
MSTNLLKALRTASKGLVYLSESDKPVKPFLWEKADKLAHAPEPLDALKIQREIPEGTSIETRTLEHFFATQSPEFTALVQTLTENLTGIQVYCYRNGTYVDAYVVGKTTEGNYSGVSTRLTET